MSEWVAVREVARRRGVHPTAVLKAVWTGRIPACAVRRGPSGRLAAIELEEAMRCWDERTDPAAAAKSGTIIPAMGALARSVGSCDELARSAVSSDGLACSSCSADAVGGNAGDGGARESQVDGGTAKPGGEVAEKDPHGYHFERAKSERFRAAQAELDYLESLGRVVPADVDGRVRYRRYRALRDQLLNIADRVAPIVAAEYDPARAVLFPARVHAVIAREIKRVLHELSDAAVTEIAGGTERSVGV